MRRYSYIGLGIIAFALLVGFITTFSLTIYNPITIVCDVPLNFGTSSIQEDCATTDLEITPAGLDVVLPELGGIEFGPGGATIYESGGPLILEGDAGSVVTVNDDLTVNEDIQATLTIRAIDGLITGIGLPGIDPTLTFDGDTSTGVITFHESDAEFEMDQNVVITGDIDYSGKITQTTEGGLNAFNDSVQITGDAGLSGVGSTFLNITGTANLSQTSMINVSADFAGNVIQSPLFFSATLKPGGPTVNPGLLSIIADVRDESDYSGTTTIVGTRIQVQQQTGNQTQGIKNYQGHEIQVEVPAQGFPTTGDFNTHIINGDLTGSATYFLASNRTANIYGAQLEGTALGDFNGTNNTFRKYGLLLQDWGHPTQTGSTGFDGRGYAIKVEDGGDIAFEFDQSNTTGWMYFGTDDDTKIGFDSANFIVDPDNFGTGRVLIGVTGDDDMLLNSIEIDDTLDHDGGLVGFYNTAPVAQAGAMTAQDTTITHTAPGTPDFAIQNLTNTSPYGFVTQDEGNTVLQVIRNLQIRVQELEDALDATNGVGIVQ